MESINYERIRAEHAFIFISTSMLIFVHFSSIHVLEYLASRD